MYYLEIAVAVAVVSMLLNAWLYTKLREANEFLERAIARVNQVREIYAPKPKRVYTKNLEHPRWQPKKRKYTKNPNNPYWAGRA